MKLAAGIALVFGLLTIFSGGHVLLGGAYEIRTAGAMVLRTGVWAAVAFVAQRHFMA